MSGRETAGGLHVDAVRGNAEIRRTWPPNADGIEELKHVRIRANVDLDIQCVCGNDVRIGNLQSSVVCQECGTELRLDL